MARKVPNLLGEPAVLNACNKHYRQANCVALAKEHCLLHDSLCCMKMLSRENTVHFNFYVMRAGSYFILKCSPYRQHSHIVVIWKNTTKILFPIGESCV